MKGPASWPVAVVLAAAAQAVFAADGPTAPQPGATDSGLATANASRNGRAIYESFRAGLADPDCSTATGERWQSHFANAPRQLASRNSDALALFGYVVDALRDADLPTEYALIPFVESGYKPGARNGSGPAGLWQFVAMTARDHAVPMRSGYDGRLSPVESTQAAVRYLKTLHGMFAGDWRLAVMAFNAGEYRVFATLKSSGQSPARADPDKLSGLSDITRGYVRKLHALSCVLDRADDSDAWMRSLDRPVAMLVPTSLPAGVASLDAYASARGIDADLLKRLNPVFAEGRIASTASSVPILAPPPPTIGDPLAVAPDFAAPAARVAPGNANLKASPAVAPRTHVVARGDSAWTIAKRYGIAHADLLARNGLGARSVLRVGRVLKIDDAGTNEVADLQGVAK